METGKLEYVKQELVDNFPMANINDVNIEGHYGIYGETEVLILTTKYYEYVCAIIKKY